MFSTDDDIRLVRSYLTLRRTVGFLGLMLPLYLVIGDLLLFSATGIQDSITAYYGTGMRDVLVGGLVAIGVLLFMYKGYEAADNLAGNLACFFALAVAFFPLTSETAWVRLMHNLSGAALILTLAYFSLSLFTRTGEVDAPLTPEKRMRNRLFVAAGVMMISSVVLIAFYNLFFQDTELASLQPVFWLETMAFWAFGGSWLLKSETFFRDTGNELFVNAAKDTVRMLSQTSEFPGKVDEKRPRALRERYPVAPEPTPTEVPVPLDDLREYITPELKASSEPKTELSDEETAQVGAVALAGDPDYFFRRARERIDFVYKFSMGVLVFLIVVGMGAVVGTFWAAAQGVNWLAGASGLTGALDIAAGFIWKPLEKMGSARDDANMADLEQASTKQQLQLCEEHEAVEVKLDCVKTVFAEILERFDKRSNPDT